MRKVSKDGVITIEEAKGTDTTIGVVAVSYTHLDVYKRQCEACWR